MTETIGSRGEGRRRHPRNFRIPDRAEDCVDGFAWRGYWRSYLPRVVCSPPSAGERAMESFCVPVAATGEESEVANAMEAVGVGGGRKPTNCQLKHMVLTALSAVVLPGEPDMIAIGSLGCDCWRWRRDGCSARDRRVLGRAHRKASWRRRPKRRGAYGLDVRGNGGGLSEVVRGRRRNLAGRSRRRRLLQASSMKRRRKSLRKRLDGEKEVRRARRPSVEPSGESPPPGTTQCTWGG